jgi:uncharacterized protein (TIGR02246 family)
MNDEDAIRQVGQEAADALNRGDAKGYAACFAADADYLDSFGRLSQGRDQIEQTFNAMMAGPYQGARMSSRSDAIRLIAPSLAVVDFTSEAQMPAGLRKLRGVSVAVKQDGKWLMTAVRTWLLPSA